eukprot:TRINITY_DN4308_c0_g2_i10.p1 TRINITY_DN4308_c0_g2~~TRINITY_DN4308_c0_g2_i10.p1  ORF type:complete len:225 (-),score=28.16 TRINITY_DN4308_c0_g2_i10:226-900(-)
MEENSNTENLSMVLSLVASGLTIAMFFSPWKTISDVIVRKSVGSLSWSPFFWTFLNCTLWVSYGFLTNTLPVLVVNSFGVVASIYFLANYYLYCPLAERSNLTSTLLKGIVGVVAVWSFLKWFSEPENRPIHLGLIASVVCLIMFSSPLGKIDQVVRARSTEGMIFSLSLMSVCSALAWTLYGLTISDPFVYGPNSIATIVSMVQLALFYIYPARPVEKQVADV